MTDFAAQRRNMVDGQVRTADVTDLRILTAMLEVPRERFVPASCAALAYLDRDLPVGVGGRRRLLKPMVLGKLLQAAAVGPADRVLDVGCAAGYAAAVLSRIAGTVVALDDDEGLLAIARPELSACANVTLVQGPLEAGWPAQGPYDVILVEGASEVAPDALCRQLKDGGRLVCVEGAGPGAKAMLYLRSGDDIGGRPLFDASAAILPGFAKRPDFAF
ncbi:MAG TPA: protein-L-isoaspartate O-methyltransferase [Pseudolabrys sp.]|nr:protein-L-isoaspartate O-methyltransferase [Pseudolabrys sp.]